jgi:hypothetical protein
MKKNIYILALTSIFFFASCEGLVEGINDNPNDITIEDIDAELFLTGIQLANISLQNGHMNRISGMYSGQLTGFTSLYSNIYGYSLSTAESTGAWSRIYVAIIPNARHIISVANDNLIIGIAKLTEAYAIGTGASLFGDIPYSEANTEVEDPVFDSQVSVLNDAIGLLSEAIGEFTAAQSFPKSLSVDIHFNGDETAWKEVAYTLQARYYMLLKDYSNAYSAAQNGISSDANSMKYYPRGDAAIASGDKNLFWEILEGSRAGDIGTGNSYLIQLLNPGDANTRNNAKTDETARYGYMTVDASSGNANDGVIQQFEPMPMVTYEENQLILAEAGTRTVDFATGLGHLNDYRAWLDAGGRLNANYSGLAYSYDPYVTTDFDNGDIENLDGIDPTRALLREIIEERFISGFGTYMPFDDARRLRKSDSDIAIPFPFNVPSATVHPERLPYSLTEINANSNIVDDPGIFTVTEVNQ